MLYTYSTVLVTGIQYNNLIFVCIVKGFPDGSLGKESACKAGETQVHSLGQEDLLEEEMATCSSILAWKIPWTEEPGGLQSKCSQRVGRDLACTNTQCH